jgi:hypothetical protein
VDYSVEDAFCVDAIWARLDAHCSQDWINFAEHELLDHWPRRQDIHDIEFSVHALIDRSCDCVGRNSKLRRFLDCDELSLPQRIGIKGKKVWLEYKRSPFRQFETFQELKEL